MNLMAFFFCFGSGAEIIPWVRLGLALGVVYDG